MVENLGPAEIGASLVLILVTLAISVWLQLGVSRRLVIATIRALVQLVAVGYLIKFIASSSSAMMLAWIWVGAMVVITAMIARRRSPEIPGLALSALLAIGGSTAVSLGVIFGMGVLDLEPVTLVVIAGITIGNTMPSVVLAANRVTALLRDDRGSIESLLALGFDRWGVIRCSGGDIVRTALIPQIERTNVVGLIALPGAMTGLLLAGMDPIQAVLLQVIVMYLVLGSATLSVVITVVRSLSGSLTADLRLAALAS